MKVQRERSLVCFVRHARTACGRNEMTVITPVADPTSDASSGLDMTGIVHVFRALVYGPRSSRRDRGVRDRQRHSTAPRAHRPTRPRGAHFDVEMALSAVNDPSAFFFAITATLSPGASCLSDSFNSVTGVFGGTTIVWDPPAY
jgi:hypothetical protein